MKIKVIKYILLILLSIPAVFFIFGIVTDHSDSVNPISNLMALMISSGFPIIGLMYKKAWFFYYIYIASAFVLFGIIIFGVLFYKYEGILSSLITILYFGLILALTIILHKSFSKGRDVVPSKPVQ